MGIAGGFGNHPQMDALSGRARIKADEIFYLYLGGDAAVSFAQFRDPEFVDRRDRLGLQANPVATGAVFVDPFAADFAFGESR